MIKNLNFDLFEQVNNINIDKYGRVSAFLALNKPKGITSHDLVDQVRRKLKTRKVGHVGALDPAASGIMLILVGKEFTKLSNDLMGLDKAYRMKIIFGAATDTLDLEGDVKEVSDLRNFSFEEVKNAMKSLDGGYNQYVPIFSSVKVQGNKLRVLARQSKGFAFVNSDGTPWDSTKDLKKFVNFFEVKKGKDLILPVSRREVKLSDFEYYSEGYIENDSLNLNQKDIKILAEKIPFVDIELSCSKGTYIRQFAYDLAHKIGQVGMLIELQRTRLGPIKMEDTIDIADVK